jgi:hypothetical protein
MAEGIEISYGSCLATLCVDLGMQHIAPNFISELFLSINKNRVQLLILRHNRSRNVLPQL